MSERLLINKDDFRVTEFCDEQGVFVVTEARDSKGIWHRIAILNK